MNSKPNYPVKILGIIGQFSCLFAILSANAANLEVRVDNLHEAGTVYAALYAGPNASWENAPALLASSDTGQLLFENLPAGEYALQLFQDRNNNQRLDLSKRGRPLEPVGLSGNPPLLRGRPLASECLFTITATDNLLRVQLVEPPARRSRRAE